MKLIIAGDPVNRLTNNIEINWEMFCNNNKNVF